MMASSSVRGVGVASSTAVRVGVATLAVGGTIALYRHRHVASKAVWRWRLSGVLHRTSRRIALVETAAQWAAVEAELVGGGRALGCLGFDCEWVTSKRSRRPVALLQLATHTGLCVLVRLCKLGEVPAALLDILQDPNVLKVGVGPGEDCRLLFCDHAIVVNGVLDLRQLIRAAPSTATAVMKESKKSKKKKRIYQREQNLKNTTNIKKSADVILEKVETDDQNSAQPNKETESIPNGILVDATTAVDRSDVNGKRRYDIDGDATSGSRSSPDLPEEDPRDVAQTSDRAAVGGANLSDSSGNGGTKDRVDGITDSPHASDGAADAAAAGDCADADASDGAASDGAASDGAAAAADAAASDGADVALTGVCVDGESDDPGKSGTAAAGVVVRGSPSDAAAVGSGQGAGRAGDSGSVACRKLITVEGPSKLGLSSLAHFFLGRTLDKDWRVRASDWEADHLTHRQTTYAAEDARSGLHVLLQVLDGLGLCDAALTTATGLMAPLCSWVFFTRSMIETAVAAAAVNAPADGWSAAVSSKKYKNLLQDGASQATSLAKLKSYRRAYSLRKTPLYHNSVLWAPDDEPLCTVDPKKANWYVDNNLGEVVQEDPLIVRLNFEPTGRPQKEGQDGHFYLNERQNVCVVCGQDESYIRKNVVPHEYRKHFPEILKSHQNHDVVLLCTVCHQLSNQRDAILRYQLAEKHNAPIGNATDVKVVVDGGLKVIKSAGTALRRNLDKMPENRVRELKTSLMKYFATDCLTEELIKRASILDVAIVNSSYEPHGLRVFKHYETIGIIHFEKLWRENFLSTMQPRFMPSGWSVTHNHAKLKMKMSRHPLDDPVREQYKFALVGSDGDIDVPHIPQTPRPKKLLESNEETILRGQEPSSLIS